MFIAGCLARDSYLLSSHNALDTTAELLGVDGAEAVAWALTERGAPRGLRRLPKPSSSRPYRGWVARCKTSSSQVANLALGHLRLLVGAAAQVAEARTGILDAQDER
jgi:hypothetical protein